ncbi:MAG: LysR family transcriptional regulator [Gammaproteobacteria bacterium]
MEIKWLEDFLSLARTRNFSRSADERFVTQPAFSRRIKALEIWAGAPLVDRDAYPIELTPAGIAFKATAEETLRCLYKGRDELSTVGNSSAERIIVCAAQALSLAFVPQWLVSIRERLGRVEIRVIPDNLHECVQTLIRGDCDFLLAFAHPSVPMLFDSDHFPHRVIGVDRMVPVSALNEDGAVLYELPGTAHAPIPYLAYPTGVFLGKVVETIIEGCGADLHLQRCFENPMAEGLKYMAIQGHGLAWLPENSVTHEVQDGRLATAGDAKTEAALEIRIYRGRDLNKDKSLALWELLS